VSRSTIGALKALVGVLLVTLCGVSAPAASASVQGEIATLEVSDSLSRTESPLSNGGKWASLGWGAKKTGKATTEGWSPSSTFPAVDGAYWKYRQLSDLAGGGEAVSVAKEGSPGSSEQMGAIWLDMPEPSSAQTGYRLAWFQNAEGTYTLKLGKFEAGVEKSLGEKKGLSIPKGQTLALSDLGESVTAWMGTGTALEVILSAKDSAFSIGYPGIEGNGSSTRLTNFKAGTFGPSPILENMSVLAELTGYDYPFLGAGKFSKPSWSANMGGIDSTSPHGWRIRNPTKVAGGGNSGAFWNQSTFSSSTNGNGVGIYVAKYPRESENGHQSIWLNMSNPGQVKTGYELSWAHLEWPNNNEYEFVLSKWASGKQTVLVSRKDVKVDFSIWNIYLLDKNGLLTVWTEGLNQTLQLAAKDSTYLSGYTGITGDTGEYAGETGYGALNNFRAANIPIAATATTEAATKVGELEATLNAKVNPKGSNTTYQFEYGATTAYGPFPTYPASVGSGSSDVAVSNTIGTVDHLKPETTYHYRVVARNAGGTTYGEDKTFTTSEATIATYSSSFGSVGAGNGQFQHTAGIGETSDGNFWVADAYNHRIQKVTPEGTYLSQISKAGDGSTLYLSGLAVDAKNNVWITDWSNNRVEEFNEKGEFVRRFGSTGTGNGQFDVPEGVAVDSKGNVWVADWRNGRVQEFNEKGEFIRVVGSKGSEPGQLQGPAAIAISPDDNVWVADWSGHQVDEFNEKGEFVRRFGSEGIGPGQFSYPVALAVDASGNVWVADQQSGRVEKFTETGTYMGKFGTAGSGTGQFSFGYPNGIVADPAGNVWVTDGNNNRVQRWKMAAEPPVVSFASSITVGSFGTGNGQFNHTAGIGETSYGYLWIADAYNHRLQRMTPEGTYLSQINKAGDGLTLYPSGLAVDAKDNVWITDWSNNRVEEFNEKGEFVRRFGSPGTGNGQFSNPEGIAIDSKGNVWVVDANNGRVQEFNEKGEFIRVVGSKGSEPGQLQGPAAIAIGPGDNVWVADWSANRVDEFNEKGEFIRRFGSKGTGSGQLENPVAIAADYEGGIWVADQQNNRVEKFSEKGVYRGQFGTAGSKVGQFNFGYPNGMALDVAGNLWVTDRNNHRAH
jgi:tripartite motif-containing protein 71